MDTEELQVRGTVPCDLPSPCPASAAEEAWLGCSFGLCSKELLRRPKSRLWDLVKSHLPFLCRIGGTVLVTNGLEVRAFIS